MKPTTQIPISNRRNEFVPRRSTALLTDYNFQAKAGDPYGRATSGKTSSPNSIHMISREFFRGEAHRQFFVEAVAFGAIVLVCAWPLATMVLLLAQLIK